MEKLKHYELPDFKEGDYIKCMVRDWGCEGRISQFARYTLYCGPASINACHCKSKGYVIETRAAHIYCPYTGKSSQSGYGTQSWIKVQKPEESEQQ